MAIDLRLRDSRYLFISAEPNSPRIYLIQRRLKDLERGATGPSSFHLLLKKHLSGADLQTVEKVSGERVLIFKFQGENEVGGVDASSLVAQLTGRSANLFVLDDRGHIVGSLTPSDRDGQRIGERCDIPRRSKPRATEGTEAEILIGPEDKGSISAALDRSYSRHEAEERFRSRADAARKKLEREITKRRKLIENLKADLVNHGDADKWKRYGDLMLANLATAERNGDRTIVTDYFDDDLPRIEIDVDENVSLTEAAEKFFKRYSKAHNAAGEIKRRVDTVTREIATLQKQLNEVEKAASAGDEDFFADPKAAIDARKKKKDRKDEFTRARRFVSSDGYEILVGKKAADNDHLTFRIANSLDLWLHAADYSGSHVVVRNPNRKDIPHRTLIEAAQLAAFYSSGKSQPKAAVHYTQKKFVNKPRGSAAGLVRLASFKTILVKPVIPAAVDQKVTKD